MDVKGAYQDIAELAKAVLLAAESRGVMIATAESCTGGMIASALTAIPGSSRVFERGFVTYSNKAKIEQLGVNPQKIDDHGAVSQPVACEMAAGALRHAPVGLAVSVTGVAGPEAAPEKPEGRVHFALARPDGLITHAQADFGAIGRANVRTQSVRYALRMLLSALHGSGHR
jgi:nicotinamide-nucleotide amidase